MSSNSLCKGHGFTIIAITIAFAGVHCLSLSSSPSSEDGQVTVCPGTTVTLTCTASQQLYLTWRQNIELHSFIAADYESEEKRVVLESPYTLTLVAVDNVNENFTSTLEFMVDDIQNNTNITCQIFTEYQFFIISKRGMQH